MALPEFPSSSSLASAVQRVSGHRDALRVRYEALQEEVRGLRTEEENLNLVVTLFRSLIDAEMADSVELVEGLLTEGLLTVFDDQELSVKGEVSIERGKVSLSLLTREKHPGGTVTEALSTDAFGGSVTTIESLLLRMLVILKRGLRPFLILDESLSAFNPDYAANVGSFLHAICKRLGIDLLVITHDSALFDQAQSRYRIKRTRKGAKFEEVKPPGK